MLLQNRIARTSFYRGSRDIPAIRIELLFTKMDGCTGTTEGTMDDIFPTIMNALSLNDTSEELKTSNENTTSRRRQQHNTGTPLARNRSGNSRRRRRQYQPSPENVDKWPATDAVEDDSFMDAFPTVPEVCSMNDDLIRSRKHPSIGEAKMNTESSPPTSSVQSRNPGQKIKIEGFDYTTYNSQISSSIINAFSMGDGSESSLGQVFPSIRNVLSTDDAGTAQTPSSGGGGQSLNQVYPFMRNVFSMNDVDVNITQDSDEEVILKSDEKVSPLPLPSIRDEEKETAPKQKTKPTQKIVVTRAYKVKEHYLESVFYVSISAVLGSVFRVFMARLFGFDCENERIKDFLTPLSSKICVTNGGRSLQTGGALFIDFPSNVFGR